MASLREAISIDVSLDAPLGGVDTGGSMELEGAAVAAVEVLDGAPDGAATFVSAVIAAVGGELLLSLEAIVCLVFNSSSRFSTRHGVHKSGTSYALRTIARVTSKI